MLIIYIFLTLEKSKESSNVMTTKGLKLEYCYPSVNGEDSEEAACKCL